MVGLITKIWGPAMWRSMECIAAGYPDDPTYEQKQEYKAYFKSLKHTLPCGYCRESYGHFITVGNTQLTDDVFESRESLLRWLYELHEAVNHKLGVTYGVTFADMLSRLESYRSKCVTLPGEKGCVTPLDIKAHSYETAERVDCPIIPVDIAKEFINYATQLGFNESEFRYINMYKTDNDIAEQLKHKTDEIWCTRNSECHDIVLTMRKNATPSIDKNGMPTKDELRLILRFSSTLPNDKLIEIIERSPPYKYCGTVYKLVKSK